jgi:hypothetical protein
LTVAHAAFAGDDPAAGSDQPAQPMRLNHPLPPPLPNNIFYVEGSTQKICQVAGETDRQFQRPTPSQTASRFGLVGADHGYSFEHHGKLFFLFGDAEPTRKFRGKPNERSDPPRNEDDNDAIGFIPITPDMNIEQGLRLEFISDAIGAYKSPVVLNDRGQPAITLRTNESPISGIDVDGRIYVIFGTDNPYSNPPPGRPKNIDSGPLRTVMAESDDDAATFHYLYDFSKGPDARFIFTAIAPGPDGYIYFWGTQGGLLYRRSAPCFARKKAALIARPGYMEYFSGFGPDGAARFSASESDAFPVFVEGGGSPQSPRGSGVGELGVEWNRFVKRWIMLYQCHNPTPGVLGGIRMRLAEQPWGPWTAPQTIFNGERDAGIGHFIHRAVTADQPVNDGLSPPNRLAVPGGVYSPCFISRFTTGDETRGTSTFYYTMAIWNPYTQVIMKTSIQTTTQTR